MRFGGSDLRDYGRPQVSIWGIPIVRITIWGIPIVRIMNFQRFY